MKKSQLNKLIREEVSKALNENKYDIDDPESQLYQLNNSVLDVVVLNRMTKKYGLDVVLMWLSSGEYGDRLTENNPVKESVNEGYEDQLFLKSKMKQAFLEGWKSAQVPTSQTDIKAFENFWRKQ